MRSSFFLFLFLQVIAGGSSEVFGQSINWYHHSRTSDAPSNIGTDDVYENILKNKTGQTVVVAVIDSGVDIEHEDLQSSIWVNYDEIPDNGIDDDQNGYIDDIHGWNFIGGKDGSQVGADTYEMVRIYAQLRKKYNDIDPASLSDKELEEYNLFNEYGKKIESSIKSSKQKYDEFERESEALYPAMDVIKSLYQDSLLNEVVIDSLFKVGQQDQMIAANILSFFLKELGYVPSYEEIRVQVTDPIEEALKYYGTKWKYSWNPDFDPRDIVGDNYEDVNEQYYGNNMVEGPDAMHGTHVSGIIAAVRNNQIGMNGITNNAKIMVIRAVPDGDERDKDVQNAIRYAVDNGASIINMSFGKGHSPEKQAVDDAVRYAEKHDVLIVHASGNSNANLDDTPNYPNDHFLHPKGFLFWKKKKAKNWISVGAAGPEKGENMVAGFSNYSKTDVDVFAPGVHIYSTVPDNKYEISQGTSMAAPVITGVAALIRSYFPKLTAQQVKEALLLSTTPDDTLVKKPGSEELVPFSSLSASGGVIDVTSAIKVASKMKGKKKLKKRNTIRA